MYGIASGTSALAMTGFCFVIASERSERGNLSRETRTVATAFLMYGIASELMLLAMTGYCFVIASERSERGNLLHGTRKVATAFSCLGLPRRALPSSQ